MYELEIGTMVKWSADYLKKCKTEKERLAQEAREFIVVDYIESDIILIADDYGQCAVCVEEVIEVGE